MGVAWAIVGAGPIGLLVLLAARQKGAGLVTVTDVNARRLAIAERLGANTVLNASKDDVVASVQELTAGRGVDVAIEAVGMSATVQQALAITATAGHVTWVGNSAPDVTLNMQQVVTREVTIRGAYGFTDEFQTAINLLSSGRFDLNSLIEQEASLEEGPRIVTALADGSSDAIKVVLKP